MIKASIDDKELATHLDSLEPDKLRIFTMADGRVRGALFHGTRFVNQLRAQHNLGILETYILGQASLCAALTIPMMKDLEHNVIKYEGTGPAEGYSVEADSTGYVRGYLFTDNIGLSDDHLIKICNIGHDFLGLDDSYEIDTTNNSVTVTYNPMVQHQEQLLLIMSTIQNIVKSQLHQILAL